jgi:hypothetical protein
MAILAVGTADPAKVLPRCHPHFRRPYPEGSWLGCAIGEIRLTVGAGDRKGGVETLGRVALAIGCGIVALCIDVLVNIVASRVWLWTISLAVIIAAATAGARLSRWYRLWRSQARTVSFSPPETMTGRLSILPTITVLTRSVLPSYSCC